jgi:hypothetical protein
VIYLPAISGKKGMAGGKRKEVMEFWIGDFGLRVGRQRMGGEERRARSEEREEKNGEAHDSG